MDAGEPAVAGGGTATAADVVPQPWLSPCSVMRCRPPSCASSCSLDNLTLAGGANSNDDDLKVDSALLSPSVAARRLLAMGMAPGSDGNESSGLLSPAGVGSPVQAPRRPPRRRPPPAATAARRRQTRPPQARPGTRLAHGHASTCSNAWNESCGGEEVLGRV